MERHLHLVPAGADLASDPRPEVESSAEATNVVDLAQERKNRRSQFHPSAGKAWLDELFDDDPLDPVC